ncbi:uncharacterized protein NEMAJ01_0715 [Nematocida major]|uniref:uncharacterized protein n=1 Tax=Nematocida major TaxID=1912982 RepID=UPI0020082C59|nr:uncharacterized protein NEMAJ01_0715 [Nematocida major]KAH9385819.1 hypothetical protein NEMAJ01_0715 [Nematocida major]
MKAESECILRKYPMSLIEIELAIKNRPKELHSYHPELEKRIKELGNIMKYEEKSEYITIERYLDGIFENKLVEYGESQVENALTAFMSDLKETFIKEEKALLSSPKAKHRVRKDDFCDIIIEGCNSIKRSDTLGRNVFTSQMIFDVYKYITSHQTPLQFLSDTFREHALRDSSLGGVLKYVQKKHGGMFRLEMYESVPVFAVLYYFVRAGMRKEAKDFADNNRPFFQEISGHFYEDFCAWLEKGTPAKPQEAPISADPFKALFQNLFRQAQECPQEVITTIEDFLWYKILVSGSPREYPRIFSLLRGKITETKLLQAALVLGEWKEAMEILQDETFSAGEVLFLSYGIAHKMRRNAPENYPLARSTRSEQTLCLELFIHSIQSISTLFRQARERLAVVNMASPFVSQEWLEDLAAEVFIATEDYAVLGSIDASGRKIHSTLGEYANVEAQRVISKVSEYYILTGELDKALKISYVGSSERTLEILTSVLVQRIEEKEYAESEGVGRIVRHFNSPVTNFLWDSLCIAASGDNAVSLIKRTELIPRGTPEEIGRKVLEIQRLSQEVRGVIPGVLLIMAQRLGENPHANNQELAKSLLLLAGALEVGPETLQEIVSRVSGLL